ncbi:hypothetical protein [Paraburkholderia unamae]|uniref:hypothetical protein n=1 Tax=Paraburkholderia unamae TaxID=219649 RepID=UPI000E306E80|nr:hypothetical protein [Paraburkholderia unamae]CAG9251029.1 membrane hypothetical protein [Paraburkholderia unamae]
MRKILHWTIFSILCLIAGWYIAHLYDFIPMNMPYGVDSFLRGLLSLFGLNDLANPDDMEVLAMLLYWLVSSVLFGVLLLTGKGYLCSRNQRLWLLLTASLIGGWILECAAIAFVPFVSRAFASLNSEQAVHNALVAYWVGGAIFVGAIFFASRRGAKRYRANTL